MAIGDRIVLLPGMVIYRARSIQDKSLALQANHCLETDKVGLYFSDDSRICLGMAIEYGIDIELYSYVVTREIELFEGKYCFRMINPDRYFAEDGSFVPNVPILDEEMIGHYDPSSLPIYEGASEVHANDQDFLGEIFIVHEDLDSLAVLDSQELSLEVIKRLLQL